MVRGVGRRRKRRQSEGEENAGLMDRRLGRRIGRAHRRPELNAIPTS